ncbi:thrombospondin type 3 repeat-containing protein [Luteolibacter arcticus]|uniref:Thrombospondin type 3 repeat-containing protein n=1 Tax=Luteolibacter arcticus TaxID=1581411 RepID=A0ABT3GL42_9BACT|nr:thrombospondin type 3 repeat-containing protein [Luteolibacter arcticus]MCW1924223.1 thrombospondin type 3 repeat-containing protein [Luteolibacter arcticus]
MSASCLMAAFAADAPVPTRGFEVDTSSRNDVVAFYHSIYQASEGYQNRVAWTGNYTSTAAGAEGTTSAVFAGDVERRLNYHRALAGVPATVRVNTGSTVNILAADPYKPDPSTTKAAAAQRSALMIVRTYPNNGGLSHTPPQTNTAWTAAAWNANKNGNLALGFYGPGAVDAYVQENVIGISNWNVDVGHRRWLLSHWSTDFATGDTPGSFNGTTVRPPSNAMYVVPKQTDVDFDVDPLFHTYPAAGFFPAEHNSPYWSLSFPGADFSAASVTMRDAAMNVVPVTVVSRRTGYGDNSIVWQVPTTVSVFSVASDTTYHITVANIQGTDVPAQHSYQVTLIDPDKLNQSGLVAGESSPTVSATYQVSGLQGVEQVEAGMFQRKAATWTEGGEDSPAPKVITQTSSSYPFRAAVAGYVKSGTKAFRLTFPTRYDPLINGVPQQSFELDREIVSGAATSLKFQYRRGLMTAASKLAVESSADGGVTWSTLTTLSGLGGTGDSAFQSSTLPLTASATPLRVRFRFYLSDPSAALYAHEDYLTLATGVFIDDITVSGGDWLEPAGFVKSAGLTSFTFSSATAGVAIATGQTWWLRARAHLGGKAFPWGAAKVVTPRGPLELSGSTTVPVTGANYCFIPDPAATSYRFEVAAPGGSAWTEGAETSPAPQISTQISASYSIYSTTTGYRKSGSRAFRLGLATTSDQEDLFTITRDTTPSVTSALTFWTRRGTMATTNRLHAELSSDGGSTWTSIWNLPGKTTADAAVTLQSVSLAAWAGTSVKLRFALRNTSGSNLTWNATKSGVWIDDITVTAPSLVLWSSETAVAAGTPMVCLNPITAGRPLVAGQPLQLRMRAMNGATPGAWGPALMVTPSGAAGVLTGFAAFKAYLYPAVDLAFEADADGDGLADGVEYAFSTDPTTPTAASDTVSLTAALFEISRDLPTEHGDVDYKAEWSDDLHVWSRAGVGVRVEGGKIIASVPLGGSPSRMMRWVVVEK